MQNKCNLFPTSGEPSVNRKDLLALTLAGTTNKNLVLDPLAVLHLDNRLYMYDNSLDSGLLNSIRLIKWQKKCSKRVHLVADGYYISL